MRVFLLSAVIVSMALLGTEARASDAEDATVRLLMERIAELEARVVALERFAGLTQSRQTTEVPTAIPIPVTPTDARDGRITAASGGNLLVTLGRSDGVREGMRFRVFHGGRWIGDVRVTRVYGSQAACEAALATTTPFRVGDVVRTGDF